MPRLLNKAAMTFISFYKIREKPLLVASSTANERVKHPLRAG